MKQRKLNKRKGFTLVELLVVIAILAVLATVSVVGYTSFTKKAKVSNDKSLVSQLNLALDADETLNGKAATPTDALKATREAGYVVEKLTPTTSKYNIVWNQEKNEFALLDEGNKVVFGEVSKDLYKNWKFADTYAKDGYSVYLNSGYTGNNLEVTTGLDVGENEGLNVSYTKDATTKNDVVIRTNGGELTVNADTDTVYHYGSSSKVIITAVAGNSYHENGIVTGNLEVLKGRVELGKAADVNTVLVKSVAANDVKVDVVSGAKVGSVAPATEAAKSDINASTTIPTESKVTEVVDTTKLEMFAGGLGTEKSPYLVATEEQFLNIKSFEKDMITKPYYFTLINNIDLSKVSMGSYVSRTFNGKLDGNNFEIIVNPSQYYMFEFSVDNVVIENLTWVLNGSNALTFFKRYGTTAKSYNKSSEKYTTINNTINLTFNNIKIKGQNNNFYSFVSHNTGLLTYCQNYVEILNAEDVGGTPSSNTNSYYAFTSETNNCTTNTIVNNCEVTANLSSDKAYNSVLLGGQTGNNKISVSNFKYTGTFIGKQIGLVFANANDSLDELSLIKFSNVELNGALIYTHEINSMAGISFANNHLELTGAINNGTISQIIKDNKLKLNVVNKKYSLDAAENKDVSKYVISLKLSALKFTDKTYTADLGEASTNTITFTINPGEQELYKAKNLTKRQAIEKGLTLSENWIESNEGTKCQFVNNDGEWYLVIDYEASGYYREFKNTEIMCTATIYAYDNTNRILHIVSE